MATVTFKGNAVQTAGALPTVGSKAPDFALTGADLTDRGLGAWAGKVKLLSIVPSLDTGVCAASARAFHAKAGEHPNLVLINISADLPFAQKRFCDSEKLPHIVTLSTFRAPAFGKAYGTLMTDGPLAGLQARAVLVLDGADKVVYAQLVPEITQEPDYEAALAAVRGLGA